MSISTDTALVPTPSRRHEDELQRKNEALRNRLQQSELRVARALASATRHPDGERTNAIAEILTALLPTLDNLQLAISARLGEPSLQDGLLITYHELERTLAGLGLTVHVPAPGHPFDPRVHEVVSFSPSIEHSNEMVVEVLRSGYSIGDRLLRAALVVVSRREPKGP
jgi:molecular chaperone GrpE